MRHVLAAEPRRQHHALIAALARVDLGFDRRRRRRQHDRDFRDMRAHHRHVAGVVMRALVLLVGLVVLLIDDDQARDRRKAGTAPSARRPRQALRPPRSPPSCAAACAGSVRNAIPAAARRSAAAKRSRNCPVSAISGIRISVCLPRRIDFRNRLEIDFGLAGAGDAVEQRDVKTAIGRQRAHRIHGGALLAGKIRLREGRIGRRRRQRAAASARPPACPHRPGRRSRRR